MAVRSSQGRQLPAVVGLLLFGSLVMGVGTWQLWQLQRTHTTDEIAYSVSPRTLQVWMQTLDPAAPDSTNLLAKRFLSMTLPQRRDAVLAITDRAFFAELDPTFQRQRAFQEFALNGVKQALGRAPALGDLWFLAGRLRSQLFGMDARAQDYLRLSQLYAPREVDIVLARLEAMGLAWKLLSDSSREIIRRDMAVVDAAYPQRAEELRTFLQRAGAPL